MAHWNDQRCAPVRTESPGRDALSPGRFDAPDQLTAGPLGRTTTAWYTDTSSFKRGIRVGLFVSQEAGINVVQMAQAQLIIDLLLRS